ncbi:hypothetical protein KW820_23160, partial [Enterobacter quasiroggenkampii]|nr:hypothetical protein [Enterobacter quasiroggenkampii]
IKGIYGVCIEENIREIVGAVEGDCSNTKALIELLSLRGVKIHPFSYPQSHKIEDVENEIRKFMKSFNVTEDAAEEVRKRLAKIRKLSKEIDKLTYKGNKTTGFE